LILLRAKARGWLTTHYTRIMIDMRKSAGVVLTVGILLGTARAAGPEFDVASIKPATQPTPELFRSGKIHLGMTVDGARVDIGACH